MEARELAEYMETKLTKKGRLHAMRVGDELRHPAQLDDLSFYALGLMELYDADFGAEHIAKALELAREIITAFSDPEGGFFRTAHDAEKLIFRPKEVFDGAIPSGNTAAAALLSRLYRLTGRAELGEALDKQLDYISRSLGGYPAGGAFAMTAFTLREKGSREMVCALPDENQPEELKAVLSRWAPELSLIIKTPANAERLSELAPFTAEMQAQNGKAAYYICKDGSCAMPLTY